MRAVDAGHPDLRNDSVEPESGEGDPATIWRHVRIEVVGLGRGVEERDNKVPVGTVGAHDPDRAQAVIWRAAHEHDMPAVGGISGLVVAISRRVRSKSALAGTVSVHDPDAA